MTWRGAARSMGAAIRAAERDARRRQRELEREEKQYQKMLELEQAAHDVAVFENYIELITSLHKDCSTPTDWEGLIDKPKPKNTAAAPTQEKKARASFEGYKPSFLTKLFGRESKMRAKLEAEIERGVDADRKEKLRSEACHLDSIQEWEDDKQFAARVLQYEWSAWEEAIKEFEPLSEVGSVASGAGINLRDDHSMYLRIKVQSDEIVPKERATLLQSGKKSIKNMPIGMFHEIYQDCIASCALRCAREMFALFPVERVIVSCVDDLLNSSTGLKEEQVLLSADFRRATFEQIDIRNVDPSDCLSNFNHNMSFRKTKGFASVEEIDA